MNTNKNLSFSSFEGLLDLNPENLYFLDIENNSSQPQVDILEISAIALDDKNAKNNLNYCFKPKYPLSTFI